MKQVYLDNAATTPVRLEVEVAMRPYFCEKYGNPSGVYQMSSENRGMIENVREQIAKTLNASAEEIYFTSGGTESDNWALVGCAYANRRQGKHIISTVFEHAAVSAPLAALEEQEFEITKIPVDANGILSMEKLESAIRPDTILVSTMYVNNEVGAVVPVEEIGKLVHEKNPKTIYHVDAIQGYGKFRIYPKRMGIDLLSVSSHKIHGPKGVGFLYVNEKIKIQPMILGGGQQKGMRSGTDNVPGIAGLGVAAKKIYEDFDEKIEQLKENKLYLAKRLQELDNVFINGPKPEDGAPHILNASFVGVRSEVLLHTLEEKQIYISAGSACSSHKRAASATMLALGVSAERRESAIRFSLSEMTTKEELDYAVDEIAKVLPVLRKFARH